MAIFYADVAGYSRLIGNDEEGTHRRVMALLDFANQSISDAGGSVLNYAGDAILAEFPSVITAVKTAAEIQVSLAGQNRDEPEESRIEIRIGIHLGDVIQDRGEVFGDGVNLAARLILPTRGSVCPRGASPTSPRVASPPRWSGAFVSSRAKPTCPATP